MSLDNTFITPTQDHLPIQYITIEITPLLAGGFGLSMEATLLNEEELEFVGQELTNRKVDNLDQMISAIRSNISVLGDLH
jgi:hypothetical protein